MRRQFAPPTARSDGTSAAPKTDSRWPILISWFGSSLALAFLLWVMASLNRPGEFERPIRSWHLATAARRAAIQVASEHAQPEIDAQGLRTEVSARLGLPLVDGFGRELMIGIAPSRSTGAEWESRVQVVSLGADGIRQMVGGDDIAGSRDWHSIYRLKVSDGFYWAKYRFLSKALLAGAGAAALASGLLCLIHSRGRASAVLMGGLALAASAGWAWDGPLWSRSLQNSPGFVLCLVCLLLVVGVAHLFWYSRRWPV